MPSSTLLYDDVRKFDDHVHAFGVRRSVTPNNKYSFWHAVTLQLLRVHDVDLALDEVKARCVDHLAAHARVGDAEWRRMLDAGDSADEYLARHRREPERFDDVVMQAFASAFGRAVRLFSIGSVVAISPDADADTDDDDRPLLVGRIGPVQFVSLDSEDAARLPARDRDAPFRLSEQDAVPTTPDRSPPAPVRGSPGRRLSEVAASWTAATTSGASGSVRKWNVRKDSSRQPDKNHANAARNRELPLYDRFVCEPPEDEARTESATLKFFTKLFKFFSYVLFGGCVFAGALVSKACLMVLVNAAKPFRGEVDKTPEALRLENDVIRAWTFIFILLSLLFPEVLTMLYSLYRIVLKRERPLEMYTLLWGGLWEFLHAVGEGILFLKVLPYLDSTFALLLLPLVAIVPCCVNVHAKVTSVTHNRGGRGGLQETYRRRRDLVIALLSLVLQAAGLIMCFGCLMFKPQEKDVRTHFDNLDISETYVWAFAGVVLTSCRYWENFVTGDFALTRRWKVRAQRLQQKLDSSRFLASFLFSLMKCLVLTGMAFLVLVVLENRTYTSDRVKTTGEKENDYWARYNQIIGLFSTREKVRQQQRHTILDKLFLVVVTQAGCAFASFFFGRVACMTKIQREAYALPSVAVTPCVAVLSAVLALFKFRYPGGGGLLDMIGLDAILKRTDGLSYYLDWNNQLIPSSSSSLDVGTVRAYYAVFVVVGLVIGHLSSVLITLFIWGNDHNRLQRTEVLFVKPIYGGVLIDQSLILNRRHFEKAYMDNKEREENEDEKKEDEKVRRTCSRMRSKRSSSSASRRVSRRRSRRLTVAHGHKFVPKLYLCATMWHETEQEMTQILTSLMRMDKDQKNRERHSKVDPDYYEFEVHILFDDAMEHKGGQCTTNKFVHQLCDLVKLAANKVELGKGYDLPDPVVYPTPYGGRLEFVMPYGNLMIVHLKDKDKIRHRKRWSQCMYMYYILGYLQAAKKKVDLDSLFILALDGDVDFQPSSVLLLLDRMKRNPDVGAACGRIHPTGSGPVVWFQKFEYAVGHWLQKTAEHVLGCVLCSPGCFSLFRGKALTDINVMNQYTKKATEALHYVQWDQGEDRWLCTLLLKQGWRIEYSAASDSFTFAPEDFKEFYNQRRRWGPSTMANIFDILIDASLTVKNNDYISWGYVSYQIGLMISSILGPATVVMIVQGAFAYVFGWSQTVSLIVSLIPVVLFIILCYMTSQDTQVAVAGILTIIYALVMMSVFVGVIGAIASSVILDPNSLFFLILVGLYAITGLLHPQEMMCLVHGVLYYLCVPSAFILLMVYSLNNMNNVSWGTREVKKAAEVVEDSNNQALQEVASKPGKSLQLGPQGGASIYDAQNTEGYYSCGLGNLCQCAMCIQPQHAAPAAYQPVPSAGAARTREPSRRATTAGVHHDRKSQLKRFSEAKSRQTGEDADKIERRLSRSMSISRLRKMSAKQGRASITTGEFRTLSTQQQQQQRRRSTRRQTQIGEVGAHEKAKMLHDQVDNDDSFDDDDSSLNSYSDEEDYDDDEDEHLDEERLEDEENEALYWVVDGVLAEGTVQFLENDERDFWKYMISKYLYPLTEDKEEKNRIASDLKALRNKMTGAYYLANALWLVLNFALQLAISDIAISFYINGEKIDLNPISFLFLLFFVVILVIQFSCMLAHRWSTAMHLLAVTSLAWHDAREGIANTKNKDLEKANRHHKLKERKKPNGDVMGMSDTQQSYRPPVGSNVAYRNPHAPQGMVNNAYEDVEDNSDDPEEREGGGEAEIGLTRHLQDSMSRNKSLFQHSKQMHTTFLSPTASTDGKSLPKKQSVAVDMSLFTSSSPDVTSSASVTSSLEEDGLLPSAAPVPVTLDVEPSAVVTATEDTWSPMTRSAPSVRFDTVEIQVHDDAEEGFTQL